MRQTRLSSAKSLDSAIPGDGRVQSLNVAASAATPLQALRAPAPRRWAPPIGDSICRARVLRCPVTLPKPSAFANWLSTCARTRLPRRPSRNPIRFASAGTTAGGGSCRISEAYAEASSSTVRKLCGLRWLKAAIARKPSSSSRAFSSSISAAAASPRRRPGRFGASPEPLSQGQRGHGTMPLRMRPGSWLAPACDQFAEPRRMNRARTCNIPVTIEGEGSRLPGDSVIAISLCY